MSSQDSQQRIWLLDTASLLSMAVDEAIAYEVLDELGEDLVVIIDVVTSELQYRQTVAGTEALAFRALARWDRKWVDYDTSRAVTLEDVQCAQDDVADGRPLKDDEEHWAEATIIAMGRLSAAARAMSVKVLLSEDFEARRVASNVPHMSAVSLHGLFHERVLAGRTSPERAAELAALLHRAGRGPEVTAEDFADPTGRGLGRVARPRFRS